MALPPTHSIDHVPRIVLRHDGAWDMDTINREFAEANDPEVASTWPADSDHPWFRYTTFQARGDLSTVSQYLAKEDDPWIFELRRMTVRELARVESIQDTNAPAGRNLALSYSLLGVDGVDLKLTRDGHPAPHKLSDDDMESLRAIVGDAGLRELGNHAITCSRMELTTPEKKP